MKNLLEIKEDILVKVIDFNGGENFKKKMITMGISPDKVLKRKQSTKTGPIVIEIDRTEIAIGRGMAKNIQVQIVSEIINDKSETIDSLAEQNDKNSEKMNTEKPHTNLKRNIDDTICIETNDNQTRDIDILLVGQPNVGKSVLFSHITGAQVIASNYHGSTVTLAEGKLKYKNKFYKTVDAPGTYSLEPIDDASKVTVDLIDRSKRIINVLDATHLERSLTLTYELLAQGVPIIVVLNMMDETKKKGIDIDIELLSQKLGVPVVASIARQGVGMKKTVEETLKLPPKTEAPLDPATHPAHHPHIPSKTQHDSSKTHIHLNRRDVSIRVAKTIAEVQEITGSNKISFKDKLSDWTTHPVYGAFFAAGFLIFAFLITRLIGEFLIGGGIVLWGTEPIYEFAFGTEKLFDLAWTPFLNWLSATLGPNTLWHNLLIGKLVNGQIDYFQSFGVLSSGLFIPLGAVLPYIFSFYLILSLLEDSGYLPRLAIFLDRIMHKVGLHGYAIIPTLLGFGCNVPGILATRVLSSKKQRFIASVLISTTVPCAALQAMIWGLLGHFGGLYVLAVYGFLGLLWFVSGMVLKYIIKLPSPELLIEMPPYRLPERKAIYMKVKMRLISFLKEALPIVMITILLVNFLYEINLFNSLANLFAPLVSKLWGLPKEAIVPLFIGFLRKDIGAGMLATMNLGIGQLFTAVLVLALFFPCIATMTVQFKELGFKYGMYSLIFMLFVVLISGTLSNLLVNFIFV